MTSDRSVPIPFRLAVFSDFDGTIAHPDTLNFLTESFSSLEFRQGIARKIASGELSLREGIQQEVATIKGTFEEVLLFLKKQVQIDAAFPGFAQWCLAEQIPLTILSAGIKDVIEGLLEPYQISHVRILANPLQIHDEQWSLKFLDETQWGHDKGRAVRLAKQEGSFTIFLGDGLSDRGAALSADMVFAKAGLARFCLQQNIPFKDLTDFSAVEEELTRLLRSHRSIGLG